MRDFLELVKSTPEIKQHILNHIKLENEIDKQLQNSKLSKHEIAELLELRVSINEIEAILSEKNSPQEKLAQFEIFLKQRWERIRQTSLIYPYKAHTPLTQLCYGLAKLLKHNAPENDKRCVYQFLMPTLKVTKYEGLEDLEDLKKFPTGFIDCIPLGCFILDDEEVYPIPLEILARNTEMKEVPGYFIWKKTKCAEYGKECVLYNPYTGKVLTDHELRRLIDFSEEGQKVNAAADHYLMVSDLPGGSIRKYLTQLRDDLKGSGIQGQGSEEAAHVVADEACIKFQDFLNSLSEDQQAGLFALPVGEDEDDDDDQNREMTFGIIWENLTEFEEKENARLCTNEQSIKITTLLNYHPNASFLDSDSDKLSSLNTAQVAFEKCLEIFFRRCECSDQSNKIYFSDETSKENLLILSLLDQFNRSLNFFKGKSAFELCDFLKAVRIEINKNLTSEVIHRYDLKTQLFLIGSAYQMGLTLHDDCIGSFFYKKQKMMDQDGGQFLKLELRSDISEEIVDIFIKNNILWNNICVGERDAALLRYGVDRRDSLLYCFIRDNQFNLVDKILKSNPLIIDSKNGLWHTIVYQAVANQDPDVLVAALKKGANPNIVCWGQSALHLALIEGASLKMIEDLLCFGANVNHADNQSRRGIHYTYHIEDIDLIKKIIEKSTDLNHKDTSGRTALMTVSFLGKLKHVKCLLESDQVDLECATDLGRTALMLAADANHIEIVKALLDAGADFWAKEKEGAKNAIQIATDKKHWAVVEMMLDYMKIENGNTQTHLDSMDMEVDVEPADNSKQAKHSESLDSAEQAGNDEGSENSDGLEQAGNDEGSEDSAEQAENDEDSENEYRADLVKVTQMKMLVSLFCEAVRHNQVSIAEKLLRYSFIDFSSTISAVIKSGNAEILSLLLQKETKIDLECRAPSEEDFPPLALAATLNQKEIVMLLVQAGARLDRYIGYKQTIRDWAIQHQYEDVLKCVDDQILEFLLKEIDKGASVGSVEDLIRACFNLGNPNSVIVTGILSKIGSVYTKDNITVTGEGIRSSICDENAWCSAEWINLVCSQFKDAQIKLYPATTCQQFEREYTNAIIEQKENFAFIPLNVPFNPEEDDISLTHWLALVIDKREFRIFITDPASNKRPSNTLLQIIKSKLPQFGLDYISLNFQAPEEKEDWIRHSAVYMIEAFRKFFKIIFDTQAAVYIGSADEKQFYSALLYIGSLPLELQRRYFSDSLSKIMNKQIHQFISVKTFQEIPHEFSTHPLMLRQCHNKEVAMMIGSFKEDDQNNKFLKLNGPLLINAVRKGNITIVQCLLEIGFNPNACIDGTCPISVAIELQNRDMVKLLLDKKANPNILPSPISVVARMLNQDKVSYEQQENLLGIMLDLVNGGEFFNEIKLAGVKHKTRDLMVAYLNEKQAIKREDDFFDVVLRVDADDLNQPAFGEFESIYAGAFPSSSASSALGFFFASNDSPAFFKPQVTAEELLTENSNVPNPRKRPREGSNKREGSNNGKNIDGNSSSSAGSTSNEPNENETDENPPKKPRV